MIDRLRFQTFVLGGALLWAQASALAAVPFAQAAPAVKLKPAASARQVGPNPFVAIGHAAGTTGTTGFAGPPGTTKGTTDDLAALDPQVSADEADRHERAMRALVLEARALGFENLGMSATLDAIWYEALAFDGSSAVFREVIDELAGEDSAAAFEDRAIALWLLVACDLREGDFSGADKVLKQLEKHLDDADEAGLDADRIEQQWAPLVRFERAGLADKRGQEKVARERYRKLADDLADWGTFPDMAQLLRLRLAMMVEKRGEDSADALVQLAEEGNSATQRRAAVVLGLRHEPASALELYPRDFGAESDSARFRHHARLAEWALAAGDTLRAQSLAWDAAAAAKLRRDRNYGLALLMEAHRADDTLGLLIDRIKDFDGQARAAGEALDDAWLDLWIELLRETERTDEAIVLFEERGGQMDQQKRTSLLQLYVEGGRHADMLAALAAEIEADPTNLAWRELYSRDHLERGDHASAEGIWRPFVDAGGAGFGDESLLVGFTMLTEQGLDDLAIEVAERAIAERKSPLAACLLLFGLHQTRGDLDAAEAVLARMGELAPPDAPERLDLGEAWERIGRLDKAIEVLEGVVASRGRAESGEDLAMHLAWLYSEVGDEEQALEEWRELWTRVNSVARRRYVEDRMMTVAARLGTLADIAIDLERKLIEGTANEREAGLLVRLYTMVQDAVSATEVLEEFLAQETAAAGPLEDDEARRRAIDALQEKGQVYLACLDYFHFEETVRQIIELDPAGEAEYLQQLAMSQLERGRPDEAQETLRRLGEVEGGASQAAEFRAGVLALAGLRDEAALAYSAGIAQNPDRIESWLLLGNLMKENGDGGRAIAMFQQLAETAEEDDLFMIAIDGLLNLEAGERVLSWARRLTWERLAGRADKAYLYDLSAELSEDIGDHPGVLVALESSLSIAGERRSSVLRELIDRTVSGPGGQEDTEKNLAFSRRLLGLGEFVPPEVYLNLGEAFLEADDLAGASRTFRKATDVPDRETFERQTAELFERHDQPEEALRVYERALSGAPTDAGLLNKVGELHERLGDFALAHELYTRTVDLLLARLPLVSTQADERSSKGARSYWQTRNIDDFDRYFPRAKLGLLATLPAGASEARVAAGLAALRADVVAARSLAEGAPDALRNAPRILHRARFVRELALIAGHPEWLAAFDHWLVTAGSPGDEALIGELAEVYVERGFLDAAQDLVRGLELDPDVRAEVAVQIGMVDTETLPSRLEIAETRALLLPLIIDGRDGDVALLLARTNLAGVDQTEADSIGVLLNAALFIGDGDLSLRLGRDWMRMLIKAGTSEWRLRPVLERMEEVLAEDDFRALCRYVAELAMEDPDKGQAVMGFLPTLEKKLGMTLFDTDQLFELLDAREDLGYGYGVDSLVMLFPAAQRASALRSVLPRIMPSGRARFALQFVQSQREELSDELGDILVGAVEEGLKDAPDYIDYMFTNLAYGEQNRGLALRMVRAKLAVDGEHLGMRATEVELEHELGDEAAALERARALWTEIADQDVSDDWEKREAKDNVEALLEEHDFEWLFAFALAQETPDVVERARKLTRLLPRDEEGKARSRALIDEALASLESGQLDERIALLRLRRGYLPSDAGPLASIPINEELLQLELQKAEGDPTVDAVQNQLRALSAMWRNVRQPQRALPYERELVRETEEAEASNDQIVDGINISQFGLQPGSIIIINNQQIIVGESQMSSPTIGRVKELAEAGDDAEAALLLRRLWRSFKAGVSTNNRYGMMAGASAPTPSWTWPAEATEEVEEVVPVAGEPEPHLGGLETYTEPKPAEVVERKGAFAELVKYDWGRAELERLLATRSADNLDSDNSRALIRALLFADGEGAAKRDALLARFDAGLAGKIEQIEFLTLLDAEPELMTPAAEAALASLSRSLRSGDLGPLRALARLFAERGDVEQAERLYRWLASQVAAIGAWYSDEIVRIQPRDLFKEVQEALAEHPAAIERVTAEIVTFATAGSDPWSRSQQDRFAIEAWTAILEPAAAVERLDPLLAHIARDDFSGGIQRDIALQVVELYLHAGRIERALECLEVGIATFDAQLDDDVRWYGGAPSYPGRPTAQQYATWFPAEPDAALTPDIQAVWYPAVAAAVEGWYLRGRVDEATYARILALAAWRFEAATGLVLPGFEGYVEALAAQPADAEPIAFKYDRTGNYRYAERPDPMRPSSLYFVIDAARYIGRDDLALALERTLAERQALSTARLALYLEGVLENQGPRPALDLAAEYAEWFHGQALLGLAERAARELGLDDQADAFAATAAAEAAAWDELFALEHPELADAPDE